MNFNKFLGVAIFASLMLAPVAALADDPNDLDMTDPAARVRDKAVVRMLNQNEIEFVRQREARERVATRQMQQEYDSAMSDYRTAIDSWRKDVTPRQTSTSSRPDPIGRIIQAPPPVARGDTACESGFKMFCKTVQRPIPEQRSR